MKKYIARFIMVTFVFIGFSNHSLLGISAAEIAKKQQKFEQLLQEYQNLVDKKQGLTDTALGISKQAQIVINELTPYKTTTDMQAKLRKAMVDAEQQYEQMARNEFDNLIDFFGISYATGSQTSNERRKREGARYYDNVAWEVMTDTYWLLQTMYPFNVGDRSGAYALQPDSWFAGSQYLELPTRARNQPIPTDRLVSLARNGHGGALYWINKTMDRTFKLLNIFGMRDGTTPYGQGDFESFDHSKAAFLKNVRNVLSHMYRDNSTEDAIGFSDNILALPLTANKLLDIQRITYMGLFDHLNDSLKNYKEFIRNTMKSSTIAGALQNMSNVLKDNPIEIPQIIDEELVENGKIISFSVFNEQQGPVPFKQVTKNINKAIEEYTDAIIDQAEFEVKKEIELNKIAIQQAKEESEKTLKAQIEPLKNKISIGKQAIALANDIMQMYSTLDDNIKPKDFKDTTLEEWLKGGWISWGKNKQKDNFVRDLGLAVMIHMAEKFEGIAKEEILKERVAGYIEDIKKVEKEIEELRGEETEVGLEQKEGAEEAIEAAQARLEHSNKQLKNLERQLEEGQLAIEGPEEKKKEEEEAKRKEEEIRKQREQEEQEKKEERERKKKENEEERKKVIEKKENEEEIIRRQKETVEKKAREEETQRKKEEAENRRQEELQLIAKQKAAQEEAYKKSALTKEEEEQLEAQQKSARPSLYKKEDEKQEEIEKDDKSTITFNDNMRDALHKLFVSFNMKYNENKELKHSSLSKWKGANNILDRKSELYDFMNAFDNNDTITLDLTSQDNVNKLLESVKSIANTMDFKTNTGYFSKQDLPKKETLKEADSKSINALLNLLKTGTGPQAKLVNQSNINSEFNNLLISFMNTTYIIPSSKTVDGLKNTTEVSVLGNDLASKDNIKNALQAFYTEATKTRAANIQLPDGSTDTIRETIQKYIQNIYKTLQFVENSIKANMENVKGVGDKAIIKSANFNINPDKEKELNKAIKMFIAYIETMKTK